MPGRTRGKIRALHDASREYAHRHGLSLDHVAMVSTPAKEESTNEIVRQRGTSKSSSNLPTVHTSDLPIPIICIDDHTPYIRSSVVFHRLIPSRAGASIAISRKRDQ